MKKFPFQKILAVGLVTMMFFACSQENEKRTKSYLPVARGADGVILVVMDSALWVDSLGAEIRRTFADYIPGLPQGEPYFTVRHINPLKLNDILKAAKNMLFVTTLDQQSQQSTAMRNYMTDESLRKIKEDPSLFRFGNKDAYARGQEILHLFGQTQDQLIAKIVDNRSVLLNYFLTIEKKRISNDIFKKTEVNAQNLLAEKHGFTLTIPEGYDLPKNEESFVWFRFLDPEFEKNVFVHYAPYASSKPFEDPIKYREYITSRFMRDIEKPDLYMTVQDVPHQISEVNFNGKYAKETRSLWKLSDISGGGGFVSYIFVDESQKRLYYLEGYAYAPGEDKRQFMREMEVIISTFKSGEELK